MSAGIIIQARSGSSRFPRKIFADIAGHTVLWHVIKRSIRTFIPNLKVIVATSDLKVDDRVEREALKAGAFVYRGSHQNLLRRYYYAATMFEIDPIIRITADCPFIDPNLVRRIYEMIHPGIYSETGNDYVCIDAMASYPNGMDAEVFRYKDLEKEYKHSRINRALDTGKSLEHVTTRIRKNPELKRAVLKYNGRKRVPKMRLTLDYKEDLVVLQILANTLFHKNPYFNFSMILDFMIEHPEICILNNELQDIKSNGKQRQRYTKVSKTRRYSRN